jgi:hypothetical protein
LTTLPVMLISALLWGVVSFSVVAVWAMVTSAPRSALSAACNAWVGTVTSSVGSGVDADRGADSGNDVIRQLYQDMGYNGAIIDANKAFPNMKMPPNTKHLMMFEPQDLRSVNAAFNPADADKAGLLLSDNKPSILGSALAGAQKEALQTLKNNGGNLARAKTEVATFYKPDDPYRLALESALDEVSETTNPTKPYRAYHGTSTPWDGEFDPSQSRATNHSQPRPYFATLPDEASGYALSRAQTLSGKSAEGIDPGSPSVIPADISISNPFNSGMNGVDGGYNVIDPKTYKKIVGKKSERSSPTGYDVLKDLYAQEAHKLLTPEQRALESVPYNSATPDAPSYWGHIYDKTIAPQVWEGVYGRLEKAGYDGLVEPRVPTDYADAPHYTKIIPFKKGTVKSPYTGETLFSDTKPSIAGAALATAGKTGPHKLNISDLALSEAGQAIAKSSYLWGGNPVISKKPVAVTMLPDGRPYLLDGYHRVEDAVRSGRKDIDVEYKPFNDVFAERARADGFSWDDPAGETPSPQGIKPFNDSTPKSGGGVKPFEGGQQFDFTPGGGSRDVKIGNTEITYGVSKGGPGEGPSAELILAKTPKDKRGQGSARAAISQMLSEADANGARVFLNADPMDKGVSKSKLDSFYESLGFKKNKGKNKDFSSKAEYVRYPKK